MFRSFLLFPLSLNVPGIGLFRKLICENKIYNGRPVYKHSETGDFIFFKGEIVWKMLRKLLEIFNLKAIAGDSAEAAIMRMMGQTLDLCRVNPPL